jgi:hypothetical protein
MDHSRLAAALALAAGIAGPVMADTISLTPTSRGVYDPDNQGTVAIHPVWPLVGAGGLDNLRGFMTFEIGMQLPPGSTITSALLRINGYSRNGGGTLNIWAYGGDSAQLDVPTGGYTEAGMTIFSALGSGTLLAGTTFNNTQGSPFDASFSISGSALSALLAANAAAGFNGFAFGLTASPGANQSADTYFRSEPGSSISLEITYAPVQVVPLPPAVWGGAAGLAGVAFIARRRRMTAN